jgi:hypothetical protein
MRVSRDELHQESLTNGDSTAYTRLTFLHLQVGQEHRQHILGTDSLGNVTKGIDGRSSDSLLVRLEQIEELETNTHPFLGWDELGATVR